jgi:hypothetical protein
MRTWSGFAFCLAVSFAVSAQAQSDFAARISLTGKVWGYLKYHHTGACDNDWDQALLDTLESQSEADSAAEFNQLVAELIESAGINSPPDVALPEIEDVHRIPSAKDWMQNPLLSEQNRTALRDIEDSFRPFSNCFVTRGEAGQPSFRGDDRFHDQVTVESAQRLLAMFRFWNILNYYSPHLGMIGDDWERVLDTYVGRMLDVTERHEYHLLMAEFTARANDSHGLMSSPVVDELFWGDNWMPFFIERVEGKKIVTRAQPGIAVEVGDEILSIDGRDIDEMWADVERHLAASNPVAGAFLIGQILVRGTGDSAAIVLRRGGEVKSNTVPMTFTNVNYLTAIDGPAWSRHDMGDCQLGYVHLGLLRWSQVHEAMTRLQDTDGIVFDARRYPRGTIWELVRYLYDEPVAFARFHVPRIDYPGVTQGVTPRIGEFTSEDDFGDHAEDGDRRIRQGESEAYDGRVMILVNEETVSQGEYTVMGLEQHPGAVIIGSQTRAADGNLSRIYLPGRIRVNMTGIGVYYPDGTPTQRIGIVPDLYVSRTIRGVRDGVDELLREAMNCDHVLDPDWPRPPAPTSAVYYDPAHAGHGFDLSRAGEGSVIVNYTYRPDRSPVWYLATGTTESGVFRLDEGSYASYTYDRGTGSIEQHPVDPATFTLDFKAGQQQIECAIADPSSREFPASLDWRQQDEATRWCPELYRFRPSGPLRHIEGLWYAGEGDRGWGLTVRMQGRMLFVVLYFYDQSGEPVWAIASGEVPGDWPESGPVSLDLLETRGYCFTCEREPIEHRVIGRIELSLAEASRDFNEYNWVSLQALPGEDELAWTRDRAPLVLLSDPH